MEIKALTVAPSLVPNLLLEPQAVLPSLVPPEATKSPSGPEDHLPAEAAGGAGAGGAGAGGGWCWRVLVLEGAGAGGGWCWRGLALEAECLKEIQVQLSWWQTSWLWKWNPMQSHLGTWEVPALLASPSPGSVGA